VLGQFILSVVYCRELMMSNSHLTVPILDVLTNLNLTADLLAQVCASYVGFRLHLRLHYNLFVQCVIFYE